MQDEKIHEELVNTNENTAAATNQEVEEQVKASEEHPNSSSTQQSEQQKNDAEQQVEEMKKQIDELKDKYLRLYADFDNAKKRHAREQLELIQTASKSVIQDLLPVLDDFERALKNIEQATDISSIKQGVELIYHKLFQTLSNKGLKPMEALHKDFNVEEHEALTEVPAPSSEMAGKVLEEVQKGYLLNGKIIRFAKVVVGKMLPQETLENTEKSVNTEKTDSTEKSDKTQN